MRLMRLLTSFVLLISAAALAGPGGKKLGAKDDEVMSVAVVSRCPGQAQLTPGADVALMRGLGFAFEPAPIEIRVQAIEDLGLLGDRRALNPLAELSLDPNPQIARAAVRAIAMMRSPRSEEILRNLIGHPVPLETTRLLAVELLAYQNTISSVRYLTWLDRASGISPRIQAVVRAVLNDVPAVPGVKL